MKAFVRSRFGPPETMEFVEVDEPVPASGEVRVRVCAVSVNFADWSFGLGKPALVRLIGAGLWKPRVPILGSDIAGRVDAVGEGVTRLQVGDAVFGDISDCGWGGFAQYACAPEDALAHIPDGVSWIDAAAAPQAASTALQGLRDAGRVQAGQRVLVNGASGGIGTYAVQIAKAMGAEVTGVCGSPSVDLVRAIGADDVFDYRTGDFSALGGEFDLVLDIVANRPVSEYLRLLRRGGTYVACAFSPSAAFLGGMLSRRTGKTVKALAAVSNRGDLEHIRSLLATGEVRSVIDTTFPFAEVPRAVARYGERHSRGKVVVSVCEESRN